MVFNQTQDRCRQNQYLNEITTASEDINVTADGSTDTDTDYLTLNTFKVSEINQSAKAFDNALVVMHDSILTGHFNCLMNYKYSKRIAQVLITEKTCVS